MTEMIAITFNCTCNGCGQKISASFETSSEPKGDINCAACGWCMTVEGFEVSVDQTLDVIPARLSYQAVRARLKKRHPDLPI